MRNAPWAWRWGVVSAGLLLFGGCIDPNAKGPARDSRTPIKASASETERMAADPTVTRVVAYYDPFNPWMWDESRSQVTGIVVNRLYLPGGDNGLGVFGDGTIRPRVFVLDNNQTDPKPPKLLKEWSFNVEQALPFRRTTRSVQGLSYSLPLAFDPGTDLAGKEVRIIVTFERRDGMVVQSGKKDFRVPGTPRKPATSPSASQ